MGGRLGSPDDARIEFKCQGHDFIVMEPFGDNSRYWIGRKGGKDDPAAAANIGRIKAAFERYKPPLPAKIFGDLASLNFRGCFAASNNRWRRSAWRAVASGGSGLGTAMIMALPTHPSVAAPIDDE
jgi:hypothetical protein